jgi:hypothetical protein
MGVVRKLGRSLAHGSPSGTRDLSRDNEVVFLSRLFRLPISKRLVPLDITGFIAAFVAWSCLTIVEFQMAQRLTKYRKDIPPGAPSWSGRHVFLTQLNVTARENYHPEGWPGLQRLLVLSTMRALAMLAAVIFFVSAFILD